MMFRESWGFPSHALAAVGDESPTIPPSGSQLPLLSLTSCDALTHPQGIIRADGGFCLQSTSSRLCLFFSFLASALCTGFLQLGQAGARPPHRAQASR